MEADGASTAAMVNEADAIRLRILNTTLLLSVVLGGLAFVRTFFDAIEMNAWAVATVAFIFYAGLIILLVARKLSFAVRGVGFLLTMYAAGVFGLFATGYLPAPILILMAENSLASLLFGRRATWLAFGFNIVALLVAGACLSTGVTVVETTLFYDPTDFIDWLRVTTLFAVFAGISVVSVEVLTRHLDSSVQEQAELLANLKGAMQLHEASEQQRRQAETKLREVTGKMDLPGTATSNRDRLRAIRRAAVRLRDEPLSDQDAGELAATIAHLASMPDDETDG